MAKRTVTGRIESGKERAKVIRGIGATHSRVVAARGLAEGRKASAALYVMVEPEKMDRYREAAEGSAMSMREWATMALDNQYLKFQESREAWEQLTAPVPPQLTPGAVMVAQTSPDPSNQANMVAVTRNDGIEALVLGLEQRVRRLEVELMRVRHVAVATAKAAGG